MNSVEFQNIPTHFKMLQRVVTDSASIVKQVFMQIAELAKNNFMIHRILVDVVGCLVLFRSVAFLLTIL